MKLLHLKVKIKSLAAEAKIIRSEERKQKHYIKAAPEYAHEHRPIRDSLQHHRTGIVRYEQRHSYLAYAFLRGKTRKHCEPTHKEAYKSMYQNGGVDMKKLHEIICRFWTGTNDTKPSIEQVQRWFDDGNAVYEGKILRAASIKTKLISAA